MNQVENFINNSLEELKNGYREKDKFIECIICNENHGNKIQEV